jgi:hypothetical protein
MGVAVGVGGMGVGGAGVGGTGVEVGADGGWVGAEAPVPHEDTINKNNNNTSDNLIVFI